MYSRPRRIPATINQICEAANALIKVVEPNETSKPGQAADARATYEALTLKANNTDLPTKVSELENDAGYLTEHQDISELATKKEVEDVENRVDELEKNPSVTVDDTLTKDGENPVKSKGIWSAIWGAIAAPAESVYAWVTTELGKKQDKLKEGANITIANDGTISASGGDVDVVAEIAGKEIKPSSVVVVNSFNDGETKYIVTLSDEFIFESLYDGEHVFKKTMQWEDFFKLIPKYTANEVFGEGIESHPDTGEDVCVFTVGDFKSNYLAFENIETWGVSRACFKTLPIDIDDPLRDFMLVVDIKADVEAPSIMWEYWEYPEVTFHPRGGDAANLEVVAGKRNVFFITEVQPNQFMVARDELALPNAGGGE